MLTPRICLPSGRKVLPKVILSARRAHKNDFPMFSDEEMIKIFQIDPTQRDNRENALVFSYMKNLKSFSSCISDTIFLKDLSRAVFLETKDKNSIVFRPGDEYNGWFFVFSGSCLIIEPSDSEPVDLSERISRNVQDALIGISNQSQRYFRVSKVVWAHEDFGRMSFSKKSFRNTYALVPESTKLLHIDSLTLQICYGRYKMSILKQRTNLLLQNKCFGPISKIPDFIRMVADSLLDIKLTKGTVISKDSGYGETLLVIQEGKIIAKRGIDFAAFKPKQFDTNIGDRKITLPIGFSEIVSDRFSTGDTICLPEFYRIEVKYQCVDDCSGCIISKQTMLEIIPYEYQQALVSNIIDNRTDEEVIKQWLNREKAIQWRVFRKQCVKEANDYMSINKLSMAAEILSRAPRQPESIGSYRPRKC